MRTLSNNIVMLRSIPKRRIYKVCKYKEGDTLMPGFITEAAEFVFGDPRRKVASELSTTLSEHVRERILDDSAYREYFVTDYAAVSGSTSRGTHLPDDFDFDVGLLPATDTEDSQFRWIFKQFVIDLADRLASDEVFCQRLALLCATWPTDITTSLNRPIEKKWPKDTPLLTYKFKVANLTIIEISAGQYKWHHFGFLYNSCWEKQLAAHQINSDTIISHICLLKRLAKARDVYGDKGGGPASRGVEQLVFKYANEESPLIALMKSISDTHCPMELNVRYPVSEEQMKGLDLEEKHLNVMRSFSPVGWAKYKALACDLFHRG
jgi:hypothetical protein